MSYFLALALACTSEKEDTGNEAPPINQDSGGEVTECTGTAPTITSLTVSNGGVMTFDEGDFATVLVEIEVEDPDLDLARMRADLWWDAVVDGAVDTSAAGLSGDWVQLGEEPCTIDRGGYGLRLAVGDGRFDPATLYEFAMVAYDAHEVASNVGIGAGTTPNADGSDAR
jgi:hypothetical protein